jgi:hypothetical protein
MMFEYGQEQERCKSHVLGSWIEYCLGIWTHRPRIQIRVYNKYLNLDHREAYAQAHTKITCIPWISKCIDHSAQCQCTKTTVAEISRPGYRQLSSKQSSRLDRSTTLAQPPISRLDPSLSMTTSKQIRNKLSSKHIISTKRQHHRSPPKRDTSTLPLISTPPRQNSLDPRKRLVHHFHFYREPYPRPPILALYTFVESPFAHSHATNRQPIKKRFLVRRAPRSFG